ncbi:peptide-methionine (S)-S-oxide reductase, partial [bacterium]|nr:peptide-methionine (S)-S-oxide reductase [bacterium]
NEDQYKKSKDYIDKLIKKGQKITTELKPYQNFWPAEEYHINFYKIHKDEPYSQTVITPKIEKVKEYLNETKANK